MEIIISIVKGIMESISSIGKRLREERERLGFSQSQMAELAKGLGAKGATRQSQALYEKDEQSPSAAYIAAIATSGADVLYILTGQHSLLSGLSPEEAALLDNYRAIPIERKFSLIDVASALATAHGDKKVVGK